jgi:hypothetical protein
VNIRSITTLIDLTYPLPPETLLRAGELAGDVRGALTEAGFTVQTLRLAAQPLGEALAGRSRQEAAAFAREVEAAAQASGLDYVSLGPARLADPVELVDLVPAILEATSSVFCSIEIARQGAGLSLRRARDAARVVRQASAVTPDGFTNLRLAVLANVRPWSPFFPAAYHGSGPARIALAIESADLALTAFESASTLDEARQRLINLIEENSRRMEDVVVSALASSETRFEGIDFSMAPFPEPARSVGAALEALGLERFGGAGSLAASAFVTDSLDRAQFKRTGFCGLMLPVLEDSTLAARAAEGLLTVSDLLMCSAVCGTGLDTIPLPGDIAEDQLAAILVDVGALALRLDKQLTARLMPLPGKKAGDLTSFEFEYFANSRVLAAPPSTLTRLLAQDDTLDIQPR